MLSTQTISRRGAAQVRNIRANDGSVQLELECLRSPVRLELLSDSLPTDLEIRELQERIARRKISALSEGCLRDTLTQLAVLFHCQLVAHHTPAELTLAASVPAMTAEIRATVDEQRRRALAEARAAGDNHGAKGRKAENGRKRKAGQCKELTSNVARERASTRPLRTVVSTRATAVWWLIALGVTWHTFDGLGR